MEKKWLNFHLYCNYNYDALIRHCINPLIEALSDLKLVKQYFFIRYNIDGPHIRLRLRCNADPIIYSEIKQLVLLFCGKTEPSRQAFLVKKNIEILRITEEVYAPEVLRYGGSVGLEISERVFELSSRTVIDILSAGGSLDYASTLGVAIQMHLSFVFAMGLSLNDAQRIFSLFTVRWLAFSAQQSQYSKLNSIDVRPVYIKFEKKYSNQKNILNPFVNKLWHALSKHQEFEACWLNNWIKGLQEIKVQYDKAAETNGLEFTTQTKIDHIIPKIWEIYSHLAHMTNNRLGVYNSDESYLFYLLEHSLKGIRE